MSTATPYAVASHLGSVGYSGNVTTPITAPLSTDQTPCHIPYHRDGWLRGVRPTPPAFYPMQSPPAADMQVLPRHVYLRTSVTDAERQRAIAAARAAPLQSYTLTSSQRRWPVSTHTNYIPPVDSSQRLERLKSVAVGKSSYKVGLPTEAFLGSKSYTPSDSRRMLRRARSGGCVAPRKKGAVENVHLSTLGGCGWGSIPRSTY